MFTVMITGSRTWAWPEFLEDAIDTEAREMGLLMLRDDEGHPLDWDWRPVGGLCLIHGACPSGADQMADHYDDVHNVSVRPMPAKWSEFGKSAGFRRNAEMVALKPNAVIGFLDPCVKPGHHSSPHGSHGGTHALNLAVANRIRTVVYYHGFHLDDPIRSHAARTVDVRSSLSSHSTATADPSARSPRG